MNLCLELYETNMKIDYSAIKESVDISSPSRSSPKNIEYGNCPTHHGEIIRFICTTYGCNISPEICEDCIIS